MLISPSYNFESRIPARIQCHSCGMNECGHVHIFAGITPSERDRRATPPMPTSTTAPYFHSSKPSLSSTIPSSRSDPYSFSKADHEKKAEEHLDLVRHNVVSFLETFQALQQSKREDSERVNKLEMEVGGLKGRMKVLQTQLETLTTEQDDARKILHQNSSSLIRVNEKLHNLEEDVNLLTKSNEDVIAMIQQEKTESQQKREEMEQRMAKRMAALDERFNFLMAKLA